jgi:hypothetical protein
MSWLLSENEAKLVILDSIPLTILLDFHLQLLAQVIQLIPLLEGLLNDSLRLSLLILYQLEIPL